ncbi:unnamed protein product [Polarella glacialis]|uniref:Cytochrome c-553 n=1 Tax=Polarella glacialis TaxID=89957 RepID=A0A813DQN8_POLGL|nr:unnamed protein product [Polarella glacialis]
MSRTACLTVAASVALYGASCFVVPGSAPRSAPLMNGAMADVEFAFSAPAPESTSTSAFSPLAMGLALGLLAAVVGGRPALAADLENGESIFLGNCAACHAGGNNSVRAEKKIKKEELITYGKYDIGAITTQVTNGYGAMPAFGEKLGPDDIDDVANYVYNKADKW